jgi:hypothetical protein
LRASRERHENHGPQACEAGRPGELQRIASRKLHGENSFIWALV